MGDEFVGSCRVRFWYVICGCCGCRRVFKSMVVVGELVGMCDKCGKVYDVR